jgi:hypothetical protein
VSFLSSTGQLGEFFNDFEKLLTFQHDIKVIVHTLEANLIAGRTKNSNKTIKRNQARTYIKVLLSPPEEELSLKTSSSSRNNFYNKFWIIKNNIKAQDCFLSCQ